MPFKSLRVEPLPSLACIGTVTKIEPPSLTQSGVYHNIRVTIDGTVGASRDARVNLLFRPEWFDPGFDPDMLNAVEPPDDSDPDRFRRGMKLVYARLFGRGQQIGALSGLCGSPEAYERLATLNDAMEHPFTADDVFSLLNRFFIEGENGGPEAHIGYILVQDRERVDGQTIYRETYSVAEWFHPGDEEQMKALVRRAKNSKKGFRLLYEM